MEKLIDSTNLRDLSSERIETERLVLIPVSIDYVENMLKELTEEVTRYMAMYPPKSIDEEIAFVNSATEKLRRGTDLTITILDKNTGEFIGGGGIHKIDTQPEFGIWIKKGAFGKKLGREAVAGLKSWADQNLDFEYFVYPVAKENISSRKIPESLGGVIVEERVAEFPNGKKLDEVVYHIPKSSI